MNLGQEIELATWSNAFSFISESFTVHFKDIWPLVSARTSISPGVSSLSNSSSQEGS